jgi:hypothetical protein
MTNYTAQLTQTETTLLNAAAAVSIAATSASKAIAAHARTFYANEIATGLLQADIAQSARTYRTLYCEHVAPRVRQLATAALYAAVFSCVAMAFAVSHTLSCWANDSEQRAIAAARIAAHDQESAEPTLAATQTSVKTLARALAVFLVKGLKLALWLEQAIVTAYFSYLANWKKLQRSVRNFAR